jgi:hypothetical protein
MSDEEIGETEKGESSSTTKKSSQRIVNQPKKITKNNKSTKISSTNSEALVNHWILYEQNNDEFFQDLEVKKIMIEEGR